MLSESDQSLFECKGWDKRFNTAGIGGIRDFSALPVKVKCLHLHAAHYLAQASLGVPNEERNIVGERAMKLAAS